MLDISEEAKPSDFGNSNRTGSSNSCINSRNKSKRMNNAKRGSKKVFIYIYIYIYIW